MARHVHRPPGLQEALDALLQESLAAPAPLLGEKVDVYADPADSELRASLVALHTSHSRKLSRLVDFPVGVFFGGHRFPVYVSDDHRQCVFANKRLTPAQVLSVDVIEALDEHDRLLFPWEELEGDTLCLVAVKLVTVFRPTLYPFLTLNRPISKELGLYRHALSQALVLREAIQAFRLSSRSQLP